jgi:hypothetical protein
MNELKIEQVKNFWRFHRPARDAAQALNVSLAEVEAIYEAMDSWRNHREALLKVLTKRLKVLLVLLLLTATAHSQTISPVTSEYGGKKAVGSFSIRNDGLIPITAVVEPPQSLSVINGKLQLRPTDHGVYLTLAEMSARIGAKQSHQFDYKLTCDVKPCAVATFVTITGPHATNGLAVAIHLPHTAYFCQKQKGCRASIIGQVFGPPKPAARRSP